jgi:hypothetical protein
MKNGRKISLDCEKIGGVEHIFGIDFGEWHFVADADNFRSIDLCSRLLECDEVKSEAL